MLLIRALALGALAVSIPCAAQEPALRDLWDRGSERFHRQWLVAGPIGAEAAASLDPLQLKPAPGQQLTERDPAVKWAPQS